MLENLALSGRRGGAEPAWPARAASFAFHALIVALAVQATRQAAPARPPSRVPLDTIFLPVQPARAGVFPPAPPGPPRLPGFRMPGVLPVDLPPVDVPPGFVPGLLPGDPGVPPGRPGRDTTLGGPLAPGGAPVDARYVEEPPALLSHPPLRYPERLRQALLEGRVLVEAVVDTAGRVEPASVRVTATPHALFASEARAVVLASRYRAARVGGRAVRVRIVVPVAFELRR